MKYGKNDIEGQTSIQSMSLSDFFLFIWGKEKEAFKASQQYTELWLSMYNID